MFLLNNRITPLFATIIMVIFFAESFNLNAQAGAPLVLGDQIIYYPKLSTKNQSFDQVKTNLSDVLKKVGLIYDFKNKKALNAKDIKGISVLDDRIEIEARSKKNNLSLYFSKLIDSTMVLYTYQNTWHYVYCPSLVNFVFYDLSNAQTLADNIYYIQYPLINKRRDSLIEVFKPLALKYRSLAEKPIVSEEQRKLFVQADLLNQQKNYIEAIKLYNKAIAIDKTAYPSALSNLALLYAQANFFDYAIYSMKCYLLIEPDADDARNAQDKIYEWEGIISN